MRPQRMSDEEREAQELGMSDDMVADLEEALFASVESLVDLLDDNELELAQAKIIELSSGGVLQDVLDGEADIGSDVCQAIATAMGRDDMMSDICNAMGDQGFGCDEELERDMDFESKY